MRLSQADVRARLDGLDHTDRVALVAAVYDARGWAVDRADGAVVATPPGDDPRRLVPAGHPEADADATVVVDAATLRELLQYAVDGETRARLCRRFFDCEPSSLAASPPPSADERDGGDDHGLGSATAPTRNAPPPAARSDEGDRRTQGPADDNGGSDTGDERPPAARPDRSTLRLVAVGVVAALVVGGVVTAVGPGVESPLSGAADATPDDAGAGTETPADGHLPGNDTESDRPDVMDREGDPVAPGVIRVSGPDGPFPPGVDADGVTDASALADAHEAALSSEPFRLSITHREYVDGELHGVAQERAVVAAPDRYRSRVGRLGTVTHDATTVASGSAYANGSVGYVRTDAGVRVRTEGRPPVASPPADVVGIVDRTERLVRWYLSVDDSRVVRTTTAEDTKTYRIAYADDPWPASRNVTGWARVDDDGLVRTLHREYTPSSAPAVRVEVTVRVRRVPVTVTRPAWVPPESRTNASDRRERATPARVAPPTAGTGTT
jgi:hypothetical protein